MLKLLSGLCLFLFSFQLFAIDSVDLFDDNNIGAYDVKAGLLSANLDMFVEEIASKEYDTFIPLGTGTSSQYAVVNSIPTFLGSVATGYLSFEITYSTDTVQQLYAVVANKEGAITSTTNDWVVLTPSAFPGGADVGTFNTNGALNQQVVYFDLSVLCDDDYASCATDIGTTSQKERTVYFFLDEVASHNNEENFAPSGNTTGFYIQLNFSDDPPVGKAPVINSIQRGDEQLKINYSGNGIGSATFIEVRACSSNSDSIVGGAALKNASCVLDPEVFPAVNNSKITVDELENGVLSCLAVMYVDKYRFATEVSNSKCQTPLDIETLLDKNQCFLATATLNEENFILSSYRRFRDNVLSKSVFGKWFIKTYYAKSPKWAHWIIQNPSSRAFFKVWIYLGFLILQWWWVILISVALFSGALLFMTRSDLRSVN